jgi:uncharacterized membrane protein
MHLLLSTIALRPYVFVFLGCYLVIAIVNFGLPTTALFTALTYTVAWACEWSSVHNGFPFGLYHYIPATRGREIWIAGVPFMDSISFTFLSFASYTLALLLSAPLYRRGLDVRMLDTWAIRRSPRVWLMAALFMVMIDMLADPLSVLGNRWFLGRIFWYDPPGPHFGVPISNYLGWLFVAAITVAIFQWLDRRLNRGGTRPFGAMPAAPSRALWGPGLYGGVVGFAIVMLFRVGPGEIAWSGIFIFLPLIALALNIVTRAECWGGAAAVERHLADFPYERSLAVWNATSPQPLWRRRGAA